MQRGASCFFPDCEGANNGEISLLRSSAIKVKLFLAPILLSDRCAQADLRGDKMVSLLLEALCACEVVICVMP